MASIDAGAISLVRVLSGEQQFPIHLPSSEIRREIFDLVIDIATGSKNQYVAGGIDISGHITTLGIDPTKVYSDIYPHGVEDFDGDAVDPDAERYFARIDFDAQKLLMYGVDASATGTVGESLSEVPTSTNIATKIGSSAQVRVRCDVLAEKLPPID